MRHMFWAITIIVIGLCFLADSIFGIDIPIFKILAGVFLVYLGIKLIFGSFHWNFELNAEARSTDSEAVFSQSTFQYPNTKNINEYVTVFGGSVLDLRSIDNPESINLESVSVFGNSQIIVKKGTPLRVAVTSAFGKTEMPGKNISVIGEFQYVTPGLKDEDPALTLKTTAVFGTVKVVEQD